MRNKQPAMMRVTLADVLAVAPCPADEGWATFDEIARGATVHRETVRRALAAAVARGEMEARMYVAPCGLSGLGRRTMHYRKVAQ